MEDELQLYRELNAKELVNRFWHIDSTGSIIRQTSGKRIFLYSVVVGVTLKNEPCLPLVEWISEDGDSATVSTVLFN